LKFFLPFETSLPYQLIGNTKPNEEKVICRFYAEDPSLMPKMMFAAAKEDPRRRPVGFVVASDDT